MTSCPTASSRGEACPRPRHTHALLARGQQLLEDLFPGLTNELAGDGALIGDVLGDARMYLSGHRLRSTTSGLVAVSASRGLLESHVRARVRALPHVQLIARCDAVGLTSTSDRRTVTGVRLLRRADDSAEEVLKADIVIDTAGRTSRAPAWLRALDLEEPDGFDAFAASLRFSDIHDTIRNAEPLDDPVPYRFPASIWRHYERLRHLPDGFAVMGDSMCSFNPIYGQGMSIAAQEAVALQRHFERHGSLRSHRFHRQLARLLRPPWQMATGADLVFPGLEGSRTHSQRLLGAYIGRLHGAAAHDPTLALSFAPVAGLVDGPQTLLHPSVAWRVLRAQPTGSEPVHGRQLGRRRQSRAASHG